MQDTIVCMSIALLAFGLGRMSARRSSVPNPYGAHPLPDVPFSQAPVRQRRPWTGERLFALVFLSGWIIVWSGGVLAVSAHFLQSPSLFLGGWLIAAWAGWAMAAHTLWKLVTGRVIRVRGGREI